MTDTTEAPKKRGRPRLDPGLIGKNTVTVNMTADQKAKLERVAAAKGKSISAVIRQLIDRLADVTP